MSKSYIIFAALLFVNKGQSNLINDWSVDEKSGNYGTNLPKVSHSREDTRWCRSNVTKQLKGKEFTHYNNCCNILQNCPAVIGPGKADHGLTNPDKSYLMHHCICERQFLGCLVDTAYDSSINVTILEGLYTYLYTFQDTACFDKMINSEPVETRECLVQAMSKKFEGKCVKYKNDEIGDNQVNLAIIDFLSSEEQEKTHVYLKQYKNLPLEEASRKDLAVVGYSDDGILSKIPDNLYDRVSLAVKIGKNQLQKLLPNHKITKIFKFLAKAICIDSLYELFQSIVYSLKSDIKCPRINEVRTWSSAKVKHVEDCCDYLLHCPLKVESKTMNYGIQNKNNYDMYHCSCERKFFLCLHNPPHEVKSQNKVLGYYYYNYKTNQIKCFESVTERKCKAWQPAFRSSGNHSYCTKYEDEEHWHETAGRETFEQMDFFSDEQFDKIKLFSHDAEIKLNNIPSDAENPYDSVFDDYVETLGKVDKFASTFGFDQARVVTSQIAYSIRAIENIWKKINPNIRHIAEIIYKILGAAICIAELFVNPARRFLAG